MQLPGLIRQREGTVRGVTSWGTPYSNTYSELSLTSLGVYAAVIAVALPAVLSVSNILFALFSLPGGFLTFIGSVGYNIGATLAYIGGDGADSIVIFMARILGIAYSGIAIAMVSLSLIKHPIKMLGALAVLTAVSFMTGLPF